MAATSITRLYGLGLTPGKLRGLQRISNANGTLSMVATDQNSSMIKMMKKAHKDATGEDRRRDRAPDQCRRDVVEERRQDKHHQQKYEATLPVVRQEFRQHPGNLAVLEVTDELTAGLHVVMALGLV